MFASPLLALIARCRALGRPRSQAPDAELLSRFVHRGEADSFEELLERYAPLVWGVCRRRAADETDAEDAFQATFLAFVRQAGRLDPRQPLGGWLHTVAVRLARKARARTRRQPTRATPPERATPGNVADDASSRELLQIVDEEIERLPAALREALILCCLQGRTRDEAAEALGCSLGTVKGRLERGRDLLRQRLQRRGVQLPAAFLMLSLTGGRIRAALWAMTMQSALCTPPSTIVALADAALPAGKGRLMLAAMLLAVSAAGVAGPMLTAKPRETPVPEQQAKTEAEPTKQHTPQVRTDRHGDPLPDGAIARLGTVRWRHCEYVEALAYSPDGKRIVTAGFSVDRAVVLWDASTGKELRVFPRRTNPFAVAFSPDGKRIAITDHETGDVWDVDSGKLRWERKNGPFRVKGRAFAPDGKTLAMADGDGFVSLCDPSSGVEKRRIDCGQGCVGAVAYSPDTTTLASGGSDGTIRLCDANNGKERLRFTASKQWINSVVFSADGKLLAVASGDDSPRLWDATTGRLVRSFGEKQGRFANTALSPDGKLLAAGYADGSFRLWDTISGAEKRHWRAGAQTLRSGVAFSPDGKTVATAVDWGGGISLWDVATGRERIAGEGHHGPITELRFEADNRTLISAGFNDRTLVWWDVATQTPRRKFVWTTESFRGRFDLSLDGNTLAVGDYETHEMWMWDVRARKAKKLPGNHENWIQTIALSPDGRLVASGAEGDDAIHIWDVRQSKEIRQITGIGPENVARLLFSPDGKSLACAMRGRGREATVRFWDVASGKERRDFAINGAAIFPSSFSPDGKVFAAAINLNREGSSVCLFDLSTGKELCRHGSDSPGIVAFSPDGKLVVSEGSGGRADSSIDIWEAATGRLIQRFKGHHSGVWAVAFAPDGLTAASGAGDSTILLWDITGRQRDGRPRPVVLTPRQLEACWTALSNEDAAKAYDAVWALVAAPEQAVPFLEKHLPPVLPEAKIVDRLIADLDSDDFPVRQKAMEELSKFGDVIAPALRHALDGKPALEMRRRIQQLLDQTRDWNAERLRAHRAIQALEHMNTSQAWQVLQMLAEGAPEARLTEEAKAALRRCAR